MIRLSSNGGSFMSLNRSERTRSESFKSALITILSLKKLWRSYTSFLLNKFLAWTAGLERTTAVFWASSVILALNLFCYWISFRVVGLVLADTLTCWSEGSNWPFKVPEYSLDRSVNHLKSIWFAFLSNSCTKLSKHRGDYEELMS